MNNNNIYLVAVKYKGTTQIYEFPTKMNAEQFMQVITALIPEAQTAISIPEDKE